MQELRAVHDNARETLESMADAVDARDPGMGQHSLRVSIYTATLLHALNVSEPDFTLIINAARFHDIGKIVISDQVLNKPARLSEDERTEVKGHPELGANLLWLYPEFRASAEMVLHHHERVDGQGYPHGLAGDRIPFGARVIAVADTFDAMTSDRAYRKGISIHQATQMLLKGRELQWDREIVEVFTSVVIPSLFPTGHLTDSLKNCSAA
jgi:putative two-component system response regulator